MGDKKIGGGRIAYLDVLRCFAIFFVIEGHVRSFGMDIKSYDSLSSLMLYTFDLPVFFFISGFLAYKTNFTLEVLWKNLRKKAIYLVTPAICFSVVANILKHNSLLFPLENGFGRYWFTIVLFECFLIYYSVVALLRKQKWINIALAVISIAGIFFLSIGAKIGPRVIDTGHLFKYFYFFTIGIYARNCHSLYEKILNNEIFKCLMIIGFFVLLFLMDYQFWPSTVFHFLRDIVLRIMGTAIVVLLFAQNATLFDKSGNVMNVINEIGQKSLAIYLLQFFFLPDLTNFIDKIHLLDSFTIHVISLIYTILITLCCLVFIRLLEQSSFVRKYVLGIR